LLYLLSYSYHLSLGVYELNQTSYRSLKLYPSDELVQPHLIGGPRNLRAFQSSFYYDLFIHSSIFLVPLTGFEPV